MPDNSIDNILIVDRIVETIALCEGYSGKTREIPLGLLPPGVSEGDVLRDTKDGLLIDRDETSRRRARNAELFKALADRPRTGSRNRFNK
ncbi:MAG: DUF3006 domain-containing protein [Oscillospiraceae bacterium]|nr:DUF3006 domain-containing protein [Oscillospiraceae bacterium]